MKSKVLEVNTLLLTRDGRRIGNAVVTGVNSDGSEFSLSTDYGNAVHNVDLNRVRASYYIGGFASSSHKHFVEGGKSFESEFDINEMSCM